MEADMGNYLIEFELRNGKRCKHVLSMQKKQALKSLNGRANRPCFGGRYGFLKGSSGTMGTLAVVPAIPLFWFGRFCCLGPLFINPSGPWASCGYKG